MTRRVRTKPLEKQDLGDLAPLIARYGDLPYSAYPEVPSSKSAGLVIRDVGSLLDSGGFAFVAEDDRGPVGLVSGQSLPWDSEQLGFPAGRLAHLIAWETGVHLAPLIEAALEAARARDIVHLTCRIPSGDVRAVHALEEAGFRLMEALLTFAFRMGRDRLQAVPRGFRIEACDGSEEEVRWVRELARSAFHQDRFHVDPYISKDRADALHAAWMENSCRGYADIVLVAKEPESGERLGFFSGKVHRSLAELLPLRFGNLVLGAVSPGARGRGIFTDLTLGGVEWARPEVDVLEIGTQFTNMHACRTYLGAGFRVVRSEVSLRRWLGDARGED